MEPEKQSALHKWHKGISGVILLLFASLTASANQTANNTGQGYYSITFIMLLCISLLLLLVILVLMTAVNAAARLKSDKEEKKETETRSFKTVLLLIAGTFFTNQVFGQTDSTAVTSGVSGYGGLDALTFFVMIGLIAFEVYVAMMLHNLLKQLLGTNEYKKQLATEKARIKQPTLIEKLNASVAIEKEADIMLDHEYDGIRELDNNLPPWWKYGFYVTIVWGLIYLVHYHVFKTGKLQIAEYNAELKLAQQEIEEYRKNAANLVDENNVTLLTDEASIAEGKTIYMENCAACHGKQGEGGVGPNLTDDYWLHGGGIKDIFGTIKYGYPEKGMKSWQQDLGARQMHTTSSYIKTLRGTNPLNAKAKQGELYKEEEIKTDSVQIK